MNIYTTTPMEFKRRGSTMTTIFAMVILSLSSSTRSVGAFQSQPCSTTPLSRISPPTYHKSPLLCRHNKLVSSSSSSSSSSTNVALHQSVEGDFENFDASKSSSPLLALYKFTRPHTIRGTILASIAGTTRALLDSSLPLRALDWSTLLPRALLGMTALLFGNAFIVGINQIYDVSIDQLNKPFLPVASGEMTKFWAWIAVATTGTVGPWLVYRNFPPLLFRLYAAGLALGAVYSVPPLRTKRNPVLAGLTIAVVRGFLLNFGVYYAVTHALGAAPPFVWSARVSFVARFMTVFASVIAITKDLPDTEGDKKYNIDTFATRVGVPRIAAGATVCLMLNYVGAVVTGLLSAPGQFKLLPMIGGHTALAAALLVRFRQLDSSSMTSIKTYYKHIWDLFYLEYVLYTLI